MWSIKQTEMRMMTLRYIPTGARLIGDIFTPSNLATPQTTYLVLQHSVAALSAVFKALIHRSKTELQELLTL